MNDKQQAEHFGHLGDDMSHMPIDRGGTPVTYFVVNPAYPLAKDLTGPYSGELLNDRPRGYAYPLELSSKFARSESRGEGHRQSIDGQGDIVIEGISNLAWEGILRLLRETDPDKDMVIDDSPDAKLVKYSPFPDFLPVLREQAWLVEDTGERK